VRDDRTSSDPPMGALIWRSTALIRALPKRVVRSFRSRIEWAGNGYRMVNDPRITETGAQNGRKP
jgi:hypothetical protein